jgi:hypothetical protein
MATISTPKKAPPRTRTVADLYRRFGPIPFERIRHDPPPGCGTVNDVVRLNDHEDRLYELVDGILVEKTVGLDLVWYVRPRTRVVDVYTAPDHFTRLTASMSLDGGDVLPGFTVQVGELFEMAKRPGAKGEQKKNGPRSGKKNGPRRGR